MYHNYKLPPIPSKYLDTLENKGLTINEYDTYFNRVTFDEEAGCYYYKGYIFYNTENGINISLDLDDFSLKDKTAKFEVSCQKQSKNGKIKEISKSGIPFSEAYNIILDFLDKYPIKLTEKQVLECEKAENGLSFLPDEVIKKLSKNYKIVLNTDKNRIEYALQTKHLKKNLMIYKDKNELSGKRDLWTIIMPEHIPYNLETELRKRSHKNIIGFGHSGMAAFKNYDEIFSIASIYHNNVINNNYHYYYNIDSEYDLQSRDFEKIKNLGYDIEYLDYNESRKCKVKYYDFILDYKGYKRTINVARRLGDNQKDFPFLQVDNYYKPYDYKLNDGLDEYYGECLLSKQNLLDMLTFFKEDFSAKIDHDLEMCECEPLSPSSIKKLEELGYTVIDKSTSSERSYTYEIIDNFSETPLFFIHKEPCIDEHAKFEVFNDKFEMSADGRKYKIFDNDEEIIDFTEQIIKRQTLMLLRSNKKNITEQFKTEKSKEIAKEIIEQYDKTTKELKFNNDFMSSIPKKFKKYFKDLKIINQTRNDFILSLPNKVFNIKVTKVRPSFNSNNPFETLENSYKMSVLDPSNNKTISTWHIYKNSRTTMSVIVSPKEMDEYIKSFVDYEKNIIKITM